MVQRQFHRYPALYRWLILGLLAASVSITVWGTESALPARIPAGNESRGNRGQHDEAPDSRPHFIPGKNTREIDENLLRAHAHLRARQLTAATSAFEQVLQFDRNNVDALLGLISIARYETNDSAAASYRRRALLAAPTDPDVQATQILAGEGDPLSNESRLRTLLSVHADSPMLNFTLADLLTRQHRWDEARLAYLRALAIDPDNPDYLFNLAVCHDHLHYYRQAGDYYRQAEHAARSRPAGFDPQQSSQRLSELAGIRSMQP